MTFWVTAWLRAFGLTLLIELPLAVPLLARVETSRLRRVAAVVAANLATHPLVWFLFPGLALGWPARLALSEAWALIAEAIIYMTVWPGLRRRAWLVSLVANAASATAGLIIRRIWE
ncbi:MAG TPA: hypothetical protein VMT03_03095 [Polyangia bacterium]|nr:hypothetical protein [Polyangia bacterium]